MDITPPCYMVSLEISPEGRVSLVGEGAIIGVFSPLLISFTSLI